MDGPYKGKFLNKSTKRTDPFKGSIFVSTKWTETERLIARLVHKVDGPNQGKEFNKIHKVDGPYKGKFLHKTTKWTDQITVKNLGSPQGGWTQSS